MVWQQFTSLDAGHNGASTATVSYRVERHFEFDQGYVEVRKYLWSRPVEEVFRGDDDALVLNMALTSRPERTRIARVGVRNHAPANDVGRLMLMMPNARYHLSAPSGALRSIHCALNRRKFDVILGEPIDWSDWNQMGELISPGSEIEGLLVRIHHELRQNLIGREAAIEAYANALCVELARRFRQGSPARPDLHAGGLATWRMKLLRDRIHAEMPAPRITELAELCGLTVRQLSRAFKAETGKTIGRFVDEATMERAHRMLTTTDLPIAEIASQLGFASTDTFAQSYRRMTGVLPSQIRQQ